ncbi:hypothetical protein DRN63_04300 [Nanoarchaeota archaeon]|nr:MAG: hypothetical protein DRN63_04300 [Nanoarchaeota archaeon]
MYIPLLSEKEINEDLKRNFPGLGLTAEDLIDEKNQFYAPCLEDVLAGYTAGRKLSEFCLERRLIRWSPYEISGIAFVVYSFPALSNLVGRDKAAQGIEDLQRMGIIKAKRLGLLKRRTIHYVKNFSEIGKGLRKYISNSYGLEESEIRGILREFQEELSPYKRLVDRISEISKNLFDRFIRDFESQTEKPDPYNFMKDWGNGRRPSIFESREVQEMLIFQRLSMFR